MRRLFIALLAAGLVLGMSPGPARAQSTSSALVGRVLTESGEPVVDAVVLARLESTGRTRTTVSNESGRYSFEGLDPGTWTVSARVGNGSGRSESRTVTLRLQETATLNFTVGEGLSERITVRAEKPLVDRRSITRNLAITGDETLDLPLDGRELTDLALLDSSVRRAAPGTFYGERGAVFVVNGQSGRSNSFLLNGLDNNDSVSGTTMSSLLPEQAVQEFNFLTRFGPEFGGAAGGVLNVVTRQGSNDPGWGAMLRGTSDGWNATGEFVDARPDSGVSQDAVRRYQAGVHFEGPLRRDRAFYFAAYEHLIADDLIGFIGSRQGGPNGGRFVAPYEDDRFYLQTDFNLGETNSLRVSFAANDRSADGVNVGGFRTPETGLRIDERDVRLDGALKAVISPSLLSETRFLASISRLDQKARSDRPGVRTPNGVFGGNELNRQERDENKIQLVQNLTWQTGRHLVKFGVDVVHSTTDLDVRFNPSGSFTYDWDIPFEPGDCGDVLVSQTSNADPDGTLFCLGDPNGVDDDGDGIVDEKANIESYPKFYTRLNGEPRTTLRDTRVGLFAQDTVEVGQRWVLEYGLRYDLSTYELPSSARVDSVIPNGGASRDDDNIAPRFGFTLVPKIGGKLVVRGGGGIFYDRLALAFPAVAAITSGASIGVIPIKGFALEFTEENIENGETVPLVSPEALTLRFTTGSELETPYSVQWNLGIERPIGRYQAIRADLVRSLSYHLPLMKDLNPVTGLVPGTFGIPLLTGQLTACPVERIDPSLDVGVPCHGRDPEHGSIAAIVTEGRSWYTGLTVDYQWRKELSWLRASYTLSRAEDQGFDPLKDGISLPPDSNNIAGERGRADGDRLHVLVLSGDSPLPFWGARLSGVVFLSSGMPYNVLTGLDENNDGIYNDRPIGVDRNDGEDSPLAPIRAVRDQPIDPQVPITSLRDEPSFFQVDLGLYRQFGPEQGGGFKVFVNVINALDRDNLGQINGVSIARGLNSPLDVAGRPRTVEMGLVLRY